MRKSLICLEVLTLLSALLSLFAAPVAASNTLGENDSAAARRLLQDAPPLVWSAPINLSNSPTTVSRYPDIVADPSGRVHVVWVEQDDLTEAGFDPDRGPVYSSSESTVMYTSLVDDVWSPPVDVTFDVSPFGLILPRIAVDHSGAVQIMYLRGSGHWLLSSLAGQDPTSARNWRLPLNVSQLWGSPAVERFGDMLIDTNGTMHVRFATQSEGPQVHDSGIYYTSTDDSGYSWTPPAEIGNVGETALFEVRAFGSNWILDDQDHIYAIVHQFFGGKNLAALIVSKDQGISWSDPLPLNAEDVEAAWIAVVGNELHVFVSENAQVITHRYSLDGGDSWSPSVKVADTYLPWLYGGIAVAHDSLGRLLIAYPEEGDIWTRLWDGFQWSTPVNVSQSPQQLDFWPRMVISEGNQAHLVWYSGYQELPLYDVLKRLDQGEYEVRYSQLELDAPALATSPYPTTMPAAVVTSTPAGDSNSLTQASPSSTSPAPLEFSREPGTESQGIQAPLILGALASLGVVAIVVGISLKRR